MELEGLNGVKFTTVILRSHKQNLCRARLYHILYFTYTDTTFILITLLGLKFRPCLKYPFENV